MIRWVILFVLAGCLGCGGATSLAPIEVGHIADFTSADRHAGDQASRGIRLALDELNKDAKRPIHVRHADTLGKLDVFGAQAARLVAVDHVAALIGGSSTEELRNLDAGRPLGTEDQPGFLPILSPCGRRAPGLSKETILIGMAPQAQGKVLARFAVQELNVAKAIILVKQAPDSAQLLAEAFGLEFGDAFKEKNPSRNTEPSPQVLSYGKDVQIGSLLSRIDEEKPQAVLFIGPREDLLLLSEKLTQPQPALLYGGPDGSLPANEWSSPAKIYFASAFASDKANEEFVERYRKLYQEAPDVHAALGYETMKLLGPALQGSKDAATLQEELFKTKELPGLVGPIGFDDNHQLRRELFVLRLEKQVATPLKKYSP